MQLRNTFKIDAIESFGNVTALQGRLFDLEQTRRLYEQKQAVGGYLSNHPKMIENARQIQDVERILQLEVKASIEDLKDKYHQLEAQEQEFCGGDGIKFRTSLLQLGEYGNQFS